MKYNFKGWKFGSWVTGNWSTIKEAIKFGIPLLIVTSFVKDNPALVGTITLVGKFLLDLGHYWIKE